MAHGSGSALDPRRRESLRGLRSTDVPPKDQRDILHRALTDEVNDIIRNILDDSTVCSELLFDPAYAAMLKARFLSVEPSMDMRLAQCTCCAY